MSRLALPTALALTVAFGCGKPAGTLAPAPAPAPARAEWFEDVTDRSGIDFTHDPGPTVGYFVPQQMGTGCAFLDADGDGRLDILLLQTAGPGSGKINRLYRQKADGTFEDISAGSGLDFDGHNLGVAVGDVDNDGRPDVVITSYRGTRLFHNIGGGRFRDATAESGIRNDRWAASGTFFDFDRDGWLDLFVANYVEYDPSWPCTAPDGTRDFCGPRTFPGLPAKLFRNLGPAGGTPRFEDVTEPSGVAAKANPGLGAYAADFTGDGWPDVLVANDGKPNFLWVNRRDGTFAEEAMSRGIAFTVMGNAWANMGIGIGDYDGDGLADVFVTHLNSETHTLWRQQPAGQFRDVTVPSGAARTKWRGTGFGTVMADFDLDGWPDLALVNGRVYRGPPEDVPYLPEFWRPYAERNQLQRNTGKGGFEDVSESNPAFCSRPNIGRGLAVGDFDNDGRPDLLVLAIADRARLFRNVTTAGNWLAVRCTDPSRGGRDLYGAEVRVKVDGRTLLRIVQPSESYLSSCGPEVLFGIGESARYDGIEVRWPDGTKDQFPGGAGNRRLVLSPGGGSP